MNTGVWGMNMWLDKGSEIYLKLWIEAFLNDSCHLQKGTKLGGFRG